MFSRIFRWILRTLLFFAALFAFAIISDYLSHRVKPGSVLVLKLTGAVVERGGAGVVSVLRGESQTPLNVVRRALKDGARDLRIAGLAVKVIDPKMAFSQAQELSAMIRALPSSGEWTRAYMETRS